MKILFLVFNPFSGKDFLTYLAILVVLAIIRCWLFQKFFDNFFEGRKRRKEEKAEAKWQKLLKEKNFDFFVTGDYRYNYFTADQMQDLINKSTDVIEIIKLSNLKCYSWPQGLNERAERRFTSFLEDLNTRTLPAYMNKILTLQNELLAESFSKTTVVKKDLLLSRLRAKVKDLSEKKFLELEKDVSTLKQDWVSFFACCAKFYEADSPILINIGRKINELS